MAETPESKAINITRAFDVPREAVWDAWTQPELFAQWYAPDYFTIPVCELDVRPGGKIRIDMKGPDGTVYPSSGEFEEVAKPERLAFTNSPLDSEGKPLFEVLHTLVLTEAAGKAELNLTSRVLSAGPAAAPFLAGMEAGLNQAIEKLEQLVARK